jgi:peptidoglycan/LPS O-acetylase OafA/YrhL
MSRRPALDGLRGLAVMAVMAFHTSPAAHGGFLGVDVFFVISGYLITTLLLREWAVTRRIDLRAFYLRRALRLGPALAVMLLITVPLAATMLHGSMGMPVWAAVASVLLYLANWANVLVNAGTGPLTHTWSLAIEEQFYLIWPLVLIAVLVRRGRISREFTAGLAAAIVAVVVVRWVCWDATHAEWIFYATLTHCDGLLVGSLLAVVLDRRPDQAGAPRGSAIAAWLGMAGLGVLALALRIEGGGGTYQYGLPLVAVCSGLVIAHLATADTSLMARALSVRPLTVIGMVSYGLYLYHFPIFKAVQYENQAGHFGHAVQHVLEIGLTILVATASWQLVEKPALRYKARFGRPGPGGGPGRLTGSGAGEEVVRPEA